LLLSFITACAGAMERSQVSQRFSTVFGCSAERVVSTGGGYRVEGCGVTAHYRCIDVDDDDHHHHRDRKDRYGRPSGGEVAAGVLVAMMESGMDAGQCVLEHSDRSAPKPAAAPAVIAEREKDGARTLRARLAIAGGHITAYGKPAAHPEHALLAVYSVARLGEGTCRAELFRDGVAVPVERMDRVGYHQVRLLVRLEQLRNVQHALRFAGSVCGREFELDEATRQQLGLFHVRVSEELARIEGAKVASSGGELSAAR
jgi:hypothetical protein